MRLQLWVVMFGSLLFQHDNTPVYKDSSIKKWFSQFGVKLGWPAHSPDVKAIQHFWDKQEQ